VTRSHGQAAKKLRLFVVHAHADFEFVEGFLLGAVGLPRGELLCSSNLEPGATIVDEVARGAVNPVTVVLASPVVSGLTMGAVRRATRPASHGRRPSRLEGAGHRSRSSRSRDREGSPTRSFREQHPA
jgi:hypothetical protein